MTCGARSDRRVEEGVERGTDRSFWGFHRWEAGAASSVGGVHGGSNKGYLEKAWEKGAEVAWVVLTEILVGGFMGRYRMAT